MIDGEDQATYARRRFAQHHGRALRLAALALGATPATRRDEAWLAQAAADGGYLQELSSDVLREAIGW